MPARSEDSGGAAAPAPDATTVRARVEAHVSDAERMCQHVLRRMRLPLSDDMLDDMLAEARAALVHAARTYDPSQGTTFRTYLYYRVTYAVGDALRRHDRATRSHRRAVARLSAQQDMLERLQREDAEKHRDQVRTLQDRVRAAKQRIEMLTASALAARLRVENPDAHTAQDGPPDPEAALAHEQVHAHVQHAMSNLKPLYRDVLHAIYVDGERLSHYADRIGKARSSVSRTHVRALRALARALTDPAGPALTRDDLAP